MPESPAQPARTDECFQHRRLRSGAAGWVLLAGLGIADVISGDFSGWNIGPSEGGWDGLVIAFVLMGLMSTCLVLMGIHMYGVGEALELMSGITVIAVLAPGVTVVAVVPHLDAALLFDILPHDAVGASAFLPMGCAGAMADLVRGVWIFPAIEGVTLAAEETAGPRRDMPSGIILAMAFLLVSGAASGRGDPAGTRAATP